jgi:hypothetical protein
MPTVARSAKVGRRIGHLLQFPLSKNCSQSTISIRNSEEYAHSPGQDPSQIARSGRVAVDTASVVSLAANR